MSKLNSYDLTVIKNLKEQFEPKFDGSGKKISEGEEIATATYGVVSRVAEAALVAEGYIVENVMPLCRVHKKK